MSLEATIVARVETFLHHPTFAGSDEVMIELLEDLAGKAEARQISPEAFDRLRERILASPHFRMN